MALKRRQFQVTERQLKALRREASRRGLSDSAVVREALDAALHLTREPVNGPAAIVEYLKERGLDKSRRPLRKVSIAVEHDKYVFMDPRD